jgi:hypothetical protein
MAGGFPRGRLATPVAVQVQVHAHWLCQSHMGSSLLYAIKNYFKGQSLDFMCILCVGGSLIG